jgi:transposase InsO family protein
VPKAITVDNGTQFGAEAFKEFCDQIGTKIHFASVRHPESNGLVERARGCRTYTAEIEGEEVQKMFLRGCRTYTEK